MSVYMPLDCDGFAATLADYLEGDAPDAVRAAVEAHAARCDDCGQLLADLQGIRHEAANLPTLVPSRDLWGGIAERIDTRVLPLERPAKRTIVAAPRTWVRPAIAAAALVIVTAGVTHWATKRTIVDPAAQVSSAPAVRAPSATQPETAGTVAPQRVADATPTQRSGDTGNGGGSTLGQPNAQRSAAPDVAPDTRSSSPRSGGVARAQLANHVMTQTEPVYDREIAKLRTIVKTRRSQLDPRTVAVLEQSIAVIDSAIAQSRAALAKDPASGFLAEQLNHSLEKKVELLRTAAMLPART